MTSFVKIWTVSNCKCNGNFFFVLYHFLFAQETIGASEIIILWLIFEKKTNFNFGGKFEFGSYLSYYNCIYSQLISRKMLRYFSFSRIVEWLIYHMSVYSCVYCWHDLTVLKWKKNLFGFQTYSCVKNVLFSLVNYKGQSFFEVTFAFS